jgi:hypothetical protein
MACSGEVVLDPFTTMCKLALLSHYPEGTKVMIDGTALDFTKPTSVETMWRSVHNLWVGTRYSRLALSNLRKPLIRSILWYMESSPVIFKNVDAGLQRLIDIYGRTPDGGLAAETLRFCLTTLRLHEQAPDLLNIPTDKQRTEQLGRLRTLWKNSEVECIESWFVDLEGDGPKERQVQAIENFLSLKQPELNEVIGDTAV